MNKLGLELGGRDGIRNWACQAAGTCTTTIHIKYLLILERKKITITNQLHYSRFLVDCFSVLEHILRVFLQCLSHGFSPGIFRGVAPKYKDTSCLGTLNLYR